MNKIRARIFENLQGRVYPVNACIAVHGVEEDGFAELKRMQADGIVTVADAFGRRTMEAPMYRLSINARELVTDTVF